MNKTEEDTEFELLARRIEGKEKMKQCAKVNPTNCEINRVVSLASIKTNLEVAIKAIKKEYPFEDRCPVELIDNAIELLKEVK